MVDHRNKENIAVINNAEKLLIYSIQKIYINLSKLKRLRIKKRTITDRLADPYIYTLQRTLQPLLDNYFTNKILSSLLYKMLFKNLNVLYNFYQYGFCLHRNYTSSLPTKDPKEIGEYFERVKISLLTCFKILLKEFNLMKFYKQAIDMSGIEVDTNFCGRSNKKIKIVNNLLKYIGEAVFDYKYKITYINNLHMYNVTDDRNLFYTTHHMSFYYWIKITNSLLKQYKQTMNDEELKQKINMKLYKYLSIVIISLCMGEAATAAKELMKYVYYPSTIESTTINKIKKLLDKMAKTLSNIYFTMMCGEKSTSFLIKVSEKFPYIDKDVERIINDRFLDEISSFLYFLRESLVRQKLPIDYKSESGREDLHYILRTAGEIDFTRNIIRLIIN